MSKTEQTSDNHKQGNSSLGVVSFSFIDRFNKYQDEYEHFLMWCMDNNGVMSQDEWDRKKAIEFKRRGLDVFFNGTQ